MVKFDQSDDKEKVIFYGPWMIFYHYLVVSHCSSEFTLLEAKVEHAVVWIRFHVLYLVYYDESWVYGGGSYPQLYKKFGSTITSIRCSMNVWMLWSSSTQLHICTTIM